MVVFKLRGREYNITREDVEKVLKTVEPEPFKGNAKYYVEYNEKKYPIKQVVASVTRLPRVSFTAMDAYRVLSRLGFEIKELQENQKEVKS
ncbi:hypothetical protein DRP04_02700 [Archaeoglobales archaeon]|nr:MAG: hypothetical protein DRP04_02700 [Archaeoglobales archaeon]